MKSVVRTGLLGLLAAAVGFGCSFLIDPGQAPGAPVVCGDTVCGQQERCADGKCVPAEGCGADGCGDDAACVQGACYPRTCPGTTCATGAVCDDDRCVAEACAGVACAEGQACAGGQCFPVSCGASACAPGEVCIANVCVNRACQGLSCAEGSRCVQGACEACAASEVACNDGQDDDCDQMPDCQDPDCEGLGCDDLDGCTTGDVCQGGNCQPGTLRDCGGLTPTGACRSEFAACEPTTGECVFPPLPAGEACDDGLPCTEASICDGDGGCGGGTPKVCNQPGPCQALDGVCDPQTGDCSYPNPLPDGSACDDGNGCQTGDTCAAGVCTPGTGGPSCNTPPSSCYQPAGTCNPSTGVCVYTPKPAGTACSDGKACTLNDTCNGAGVCVGGATRTCTSPPGQCYQATGTCNAATGQCTYAPKATGAACNDGNPCTAPDTCNGSGTCRAGGARSNGSSCGNVPAEVCCGGTCVNVSNNEKHCGGCNAGCAAGRTCEPVSSTTSCSPHPSGVSGRCTCAGATAECPTGQNGRQICRTVTPYANRCTPDGVGHCKPGASFVDVNFCPNYCRY